MKKIIYCITDDKIGHIRQTEGLALALQSIRDCEIRWLPALSWFSLFKSSGKVMLPIASNSIVMGAGHRTHLALLYYKLRYQAKAIVIMKPSFPKRWFDYCIVPQHDHVAEQGNVLVTVGAMNALSLKPVIKKEQITVLIGGPSSACDWNNSTVYHELNNLLLPVEGNKNILLSTSRRTPVAFLKNLPENIRSRVCIIDYQDVDAEWLPKILLESSDAWVTAESISMIYESLSAGCQVQVIDVPRLSGKIAENLLFLRQNNRVDQQVNIEPRLNESHRVAQKLINLGLFNETTNDTD